jgi:hypothetical protein
MFPIFEPVMVMFQPIVTGFVTLAVAAVGGMIAVLGLVVLDGRRPRRARTSPRTGVVRRLREAA